MAGSHPNHRYASMEKLDTQAHRLQAQRRDRLAIDAIGLGEIFTRKRLGELHDVATLELKVPVPAISFLLSGARAPFFPITIKD